MWKCLQDPMCSFLFFSALSMTFSHPEIFLIHNRKKYHVQPEKLASGQVE